MSRYRCTDIFTDFVHPSINASINNGDFPSFLNLANVIPVFKKDWKISKDNYRPITLLKNLSKAYKRILLKQIRRNTKGTFMDFFFKISMRLKKRLSTKQSLLALIEKWKSVVDKGKSFVTLLTNFSIIFDCLPHRLPIVNYIHMVSV